MLTNSVLRTLSDTIVLSFEVVQIHGIFSTTGRMCWTIFVKIRLKNVSQKIVSIFQQSDQNVFRVGTISYQRVFRLPVWRWLVGIPIAARTRRTRNRID